MDNNIIINKRILKDKYLFKLQLTYGSKNCQVKQYSQDEYVEAVISDNYKEIKLNKPLLFTKNNKEKSVEFLKIPKESLVEVMSFVK